ncbi:MAG: GGDEF domain-containing protein [Gallionella sp.]|nr:GGDEF domain-containing protein [Gallionella sp.]
MMNPLDHALISQNRLFYGVDFSSVEYFLEHCAVQALAEGDTLLQPEVANGHLYLIMEGELTVHLLAQETLKHTSLQAGECVGDISLVDGKPPSALVSAAVPTRVLAIPHNTVWSLVDSSHEISRNLLQIIAGRMRNDNRALIASQNERAQFQHKASVDALTGIHNRHWMKDAFPRALHRCAESSSPTAVMVADIDHFKRVNDTYGHLVGDTTLKMVARSMAKHLRPHDLLVRYGGEEFAMLLPDTSSEDARAIAERLRTSIAGSQVENGEQPFRVTISIGIAPALKEEPVDALIGKADQALYRAKELGRNRVEMFD